MRILVISMQFPHFPAPGGQTRQFHLLKEAAREHEITLLTVAQSPNETALQELKSFVREVIVLDRIYPCSTSPVVAGMSYSQLLKELVSKEPFEIRKWRAKLEVPEYLERIAETDYDLIQVEHSELAHWVDGYFANTPKVLVLHNVNYIIYKRFFDIAPWSKEKIWALAQWLNMKKYETSLSGKFDKYIAMSDNDRLFFHALVPHADVTVVPNGVDVEYFSPDEATAEEDGVVYTGYMGWKPSIDAVVTFCREIFPELRRSYPDLKFYIVGKDPSEEVKALAKDKNVIVTGFVDDVRPFVRRAKLVVIPLRVGGGTRLKILEAMSMGKAVVSTCIGAEGLDVSDGENIFLADDFMSFAEKCRMVLGDQALRKSMGEKARTKAVVNYSWPYIGTSLLDFYKQIEAKKN
jgi:sugar transferase (PEP-CTERM/EpsH1 system associated)